MDWITNFVSLAAVFMFIWQMRNDSKSDYIRLEKRLEEWRAETNEMMKQFHEEMKLFHGRVCALETKKSKDK